MRPQAWAFPIAFILNLMPVRRPGRIPRPPGATNLRSAPGVKVHLHVRHMLTYDLLYIDRLTWPFYSRPAEDFCGFRATPCAVGSYGGKICCRQDQRDTPTPAKCGRQPSGLPTISRIAPRRSLRCVRPTRLRKGATTPTMAGPAYSTTVRFNDVRALVLTPASPLAVR